MDSDRLRITGSDVAISGDRAGVVLAEGGAP